MSLTRGSRNGLSWLKPALLCAAMIWGAFTAGAGEVEDEPPQLATGAIEGQVLNAANMRPVARALVTLLPHNGGPGDAGGNGDEAGDFPLGNMIPFTLTNEHGEFHFRHVPAGAYRLLAVHRGFLPELQDVAVAPHEVAEVLMLLTPHDPLRPGSIAGRVSDARTSEPIGRAWVRLTAPPTDSLEDRHALTTRTNARGFYRFGHVRPGQYQIIAAKRGYLPERKPVVVESGERARCDFELTHTTATATLQGLVTDARTSEPIAGVLIAVPLCELPGHTVNDDNALTTRTNAAGQYTLPGVPLGPQRVIALHPDYFPQRKPALIQPDRPNVVDFALEPRPASAGPLVVFAADANTSAPLRGVRVHLALQEDAEPHSALDHWRKVTNEQGIAVFPRVPEGEFVVTGELRGYLTAMAHVSSADLPATVTLALIPDPNLQTSTQWYFACGGISAFQQTWLLVINPSTTETANLALTLFFEDAEPLTVVEDVAPNSRFTFNLTAIVRSNTDPTTPATRLIPFAMELLSDNGVPVYAERSIYWHAAGHPRGGGSASVGATELANEWFFAEGSTTNHRRTIICVGNPNADATTVTVTYLLEAAEPVVAVYPLGGERRLTINAAADVPNANFSVQLESELPVVAEREMFGRAGQVQDKWGHNAPGVTEPSDCWLFAEGATHRSFATFLLLANINDHPVTARIRFLPDHGAPVEKSETLAARSRLTINVEARYPELNDQAGFGAEVKTADGSPIVVERSIYWTGDGYDERSGATAAAGLTRPARRWLLPEGAVGGPSGFENFILCANTAEQAAQVRVTFVKPDGGSVARQFTIGAGRRLTVKANDFLGGADTQSCAAIVESVNGAPIIVERALYWSNRLEGHASGGIPAEN